MELLCAVEVLGNKPSNRIGIVKFYETGYYPTKLDRPEYTREQVKEEIDVYNQGQGIPKDVAESAALASIFGWHVPAANKAIDFFKQRSLTEVA